MDRQELISLGARLKVVLCEAVPEQNVIATAGFCVDSDVVTLSFHVTAQDGYQVAKAEARRG